MAWKIPPPAGDLPENRFDFELPDGTVASVPKSGFASPAALKFMREVPPDRMRVDYVLGLIEVYDGDAAQKLRGADLHEDQINALFDEWVRVSKMTPGESSASSSSSKGTRRR